MSRRLTGLAAAVALAAALPALAPSALAQAPAPAPVPTITFRSAGEIEGLIAKAKAERKPDQANFIQPVLSLAPYRANLEYRTASAAAAVHEAEAELFFVYEGGGTFVTGGKLTGETRTNPANLTGTGIEGGTTRHVVKGDAFIVPQGTPHQFTQVDGPALVLISFHVPRTTP